MFEKLKALFLSSSEEKKSVMTFEFALAALLVEVMRADGKFDPKELSCITELLEQHTDLPHSACVHMQAQAQEAVESAIDLHAFVSTVNANTSAEERIEVICFLWLVAVSDGKVDPQEEYIIRKIAGLMYVSHSDFIAAKLVAEENLS